jgi:hypothetical protein
MTKAFIAFCLALLASLAAAGNPAFTVSRISDQASGLQATVFSFEPAQNNGFGILDVPAKQAGDNISKHFDRAKHGLMTNGGYFDAKFEPDC